MRRELLSIPITSKCWLSSTASGSPTYPKPTTHIFFISMFICFPSLYIFLHYMFPFTTLFSTIPFSSFFSTFLYFSSLPRLVLLCLILPSQPLLVLFHEVIFPIPLDKFFDSIFYLRHRLPL